MTKFIAYYRVSTNEQGASGHGLAAQRETVERFAAQSGEIIAEFTEIESGRKNDRPQLAAALALCRSKRARLVIAKLDRLARNVAFISNLMESGVEFVACDVPEANRLMLQILAVFAEHEREMISARTKSALAAVKARGVILGNPQLDRFRPRASEARSAAANRFAETVFPLIEKLRSQGMTYRAIAADLNSRGVKSANGRSWHHTAVRNVYTRQQPLTSIAA